MFAFRYISFIIQRQHSVGPVHLIRFIIHFLDMQFHGFALIHKLGRPLKTFLSFIRFQNIVFIEIIVTSYQAQRAVRIIRELHNALSPVILGIFPLSNHTAHKTLRLHFRFLSVGLGTLLLYADADHRITAGNHDFGHAVFTGEVGQQSKLQSIFTGFTAIQIQFQPFHLTGTRLDTYCLHFGFPRSCGYKLDTFLLMGIIGIHRLMGRCALGQFDRLHRIVITTTSSQ